MDAFLTLYSDVEAISKEARTSGEAIKFFNRSREKLESELRYFYTRKETSSESSLEEISTKHAFLALIYWLYPNHVGYNRTRNAIRMYQHAAAAQATSKLKTNFAYCSGLMVQLRITPFLVREKKKTIENLAAARAEAAGFLSSTELAPRNDLSSLVFDGLGFSYFLLERDIDTALTFLTRAVRNFQSCERTLSTNYERNGAGRTKSAKNRIQFLRSLASVLYWDLGICYEGKAELTEGEDMLDLVRKARSQYQRSFDYAMRSPWHIYRAMSAYNLSGTYFKEGTSQFERKKAVPLLRRSVEIGEDSLKWFRLWSSFEGDFLGGSWIASFYQHLANYSDDSSREKLMRRSLQLAEKAESLINNRRVGMSRYKAVNIGDIFYRNSEYNRQIATELRFSEKGSPESSREVRVLDLLNRSLVECLKSRTFYRDRAFENRRINSDLLAGDICYDLLNSTSRNEGQWRKWSSKAKRYFHDAAKISEGLKLHETLATSRWRLGQVFDKEGLFGQSASEFRKAHDAFEEIRRSSSNAHLYNEFSRYMLAWSEIENAKSAHVSSDFEEAARLYREAFSLVATTRRWKPRSYLYFAESLIEEAEKLSFAESSVAAIESFSKAEQSLSKLESGLSTDNSIEARSFTALGRHLSAFCEARIILERSKEDFRSGNVERSVSGLSEAESAFSRLSQDYSLANPLEANELMSLASLCSALKHFQKAQMDGDAALIQKAGNIFSIASQKSKSASLKPLLRGLSSFAAFLYSSKMVEKSLESSIDIERLSECSKALDSAERILGRIGNKSFLVMLRANKHILDASIKISAAEREVENQEVKAKLYSQAQRALSLASKYYEELGSSEKLKESLRLLSTVKQSRELIPLANEMFAQVASSQLIYSAISSTSILGSSPEDSARQIDSSFLVLDVSVEHPLISQGDKLHTTFVISNFGKERAIASGIQEAVPEGFELLLSYDEKRKFKDRFMILNLKLEPGASETIGVLAQPSSIGEFIWHPSLLYQDSRGNQKSTRTENAKVVVESEDLESIVEALRLKKDRLEAELSGQPSSTDATISLREELSRAEEELRRFSNEYESLSMQLDQVRQDLLALNAMQDEVLKQEEKKKLEMEERILMQRTERRRALFQPQQNM